MKTEDLGAIIRRIAILVLIVFAIVHLGGPSWQKVLVWNLPDNDDIMRVLQVRAWLNGQGFYDLINHRLNPPNGGDIHWSRLADIPLAIGNLVLRPFVGIAMAEKMAAFAVPLILCGILAYVAGRTSKAIANSYIALFIGAFVAVSTPAIMGYFVAGRTDHHGLQLIFMVCAFWGMVSHNKKGAMLAGLSIAASITIGFEMVPLMVLMVAWAAIIWGIRGEENRPQTIYFSIWLGIGITLGYLINVAPEHYFEGANDRLSIAQIAPILGGCLLLAFASMFASRASMIVRFFSLAIIGIVVIAIAAQFPVLLKPLYWQTDPLLHRLWLKIVVETFPLIKTDNEVKILLGAFSFFVMIATIARLVLLIIDEKSRKNHRDVDNWSLLASLLTASMLLAMFFQARTAGQAAGIAVIAAAALVTSVYKEKGLLTALLVGAFVNPLVPALVSMAYEKIAPKKKTPYVTGGGNTCGTDAAYSELAKQPKGLIASNIDFGAHALISTPHDVLAAPYHRNTGNFTSYDIFLSNPDVAFEKAKKRGVTYIAYCAKSAETGNLAREAPNGLMAQLKANKVPAYLVAIPTPPKSDVVAFAINYGAKP